MDWGRMTVFGVVATAMLTVLMLGAQLSGRTRLDLPLVLGTLVIEDPDRARIAGVLVHLSMGQLFSLFCAAGFAAFDDTKPKTSSTSSSPSAAHSASTPRRWTRQPGAHLGNQPQALTHAALLRAAYARQAPTQRFGAGREDDT
jgi:hypothetical protein